MAGHSPAELGNEMTNNELKQIRRLLFIDVIEAARLIGKCEPRTWQRWEKGDRAIPSDVVEVLTMLALTRHDLLSVSFNENDPSYCYFETFSEYKDAGGGGNELMWRLAQSVSAELLAENLAAVCESEEIIQ